MQICHSVTKVTLLVSTLHWEALLVATNKNRNWKCVLTQFVRNYTNLAMLAIKAYIGKSKTHPASKKVTCTGDGTCNLLRPTLIPS